MTGIGIMGGTFDPVHAGHLACASGAADALGLAQVLFIPTGRPNFKQDVAVTDAADRVAMLRLALGEIGDARFALDTREVERAGVTYSVDTLEELAAENPGRRLFFIMGADAAATLVHWKAAARVAELCTVVAVARPGYDFAVLRETLETAPIPFTVEYLELATPDVSSTQVRARVAAGLPAGGLVPDAVVEYIDRHHLYRD